MLTFDLSSWVPAITSSVAVGLLTFAGGILFRSAIEKGFQHVLDRRLEGVRAQLRRDEEELRAELRTRDAQIAALRDGVLSGMLTRSSEIDRRRIDAVEQLWSKTVELGRTKNLGVLAAALSSEDIARAASKKDAEGEQLRSFAEGILQSGGFGDFATYDNSADKLRPFVDPVVWALFVAFRQLMLLPKLQLYAVKTGNPKILRALDSIVAPAKAALPEYSEYLEKQGLGGLAHMMAPLEEKLFEALTASLEGTVSDASALQRASSIVRAVDTAVATMQAAASPQSLDLP